MKVKSENGIILYQDKNGIVRVNRSVHRVRFMTDSESMFEALRITGMLRMER